MASLSLSQHARVRMQQRGIPSRAVELLLEHGAVQHDHHGGRVLYFDKARQRKLRQVLEPEAVAGMERFFKAYAVMRRGEVLTVGWRYRRIRR